MNENNPKFKHYEEMLREWNSRMNLVAPSTLGDIQTRHIKDSMQLVPYLPKDAKIIDLGSGAGFPAVVLAILGFNVTAIESIAKKCMFLEAVKKELDLPNLMIINDRVEHIVKNSATLCSLLSTLKTSANALVFTARAFAPLIKIFDLTGGAGVVGRDLWARRYLLLKGESIESEIKTAKEKYNFDYELIPSETGPGFIVKIDNVKLAKNIPLKNRPF